MEATAEAQAQKEYATQLLGFTPSSFADEVTEDSLDLLQAAFKSMKQKVCGVERLGKRSRIAENVSQAKTKACRMQYDLDISRVGSDPALVENGSLRPYSGCFL